MGELIVVTGPPGAGKSTVARVLADRFPRSALVTGDSFFAFVSGGWVAPWLPEAHEQNDVVLRAAASVKPWPVRPATRARHSCSEGSSTT